MRIINLSCFHDEKGLESCCNIDLRLFTEEFLANHPKPNVLVTDPPRDGMHQKVVEQILKLAPPKIVYVSCNSATQARDLALMKEHYDVVKILPVDMFPSHDTSAINKKITKLGVRNRILNFFIL